MYKTTSHHNTRDGVRCVTPLHAFSLNSTVQKGAGEENLLNVPNPLPMHQATEILMPALILALTFLGAITYGRTPSTGQTTRTGSPSTLIKATVPSFPVLKEAEIGVVPKLLAV